jgi:hypothetical protein
MIEHLEKREANHGQVRVSSKEGFQLVLPEVHEPRYCLAQLDDYMHLPRRKFPYRHPFNMKLEARVSGDNLPGTWGFGLWNDPFSVGFIAGGVSRLMPVLPNAAWFFYGSAENYLSLQDDTPASGFHVKTFRSPQIPSFFSLFTLPLIPLLFCPFTARTLRRLARGFVKEDGKSLTIDATVWHSYGMTWRDESVEFAVDGNMVFQTTFSPQGRLGLVIWIDNQYFRFDPQGKIRFGSQKLESRQSLSIRGIELKNL